MLNVPVLCKCVVFFLSQMWKFIVEMFESSVHTPELNLTQGEDGSGRTAGATVTAVVRSCKNCVLNVRMAEEGYQMCSGCY